jgi:hypothetical protein
MPRILLLLFVLVSSLEVSAQSLVEPSITITSPNDTSILYAKDQWAYLSVETTGDLTDSVTFEYTINDGVTWTRIIRVAHDKITKNVAQIIIPDVDADAYIRATMASKVIGTSKTFKIIGYPKPTALFINDNEWPVPVDADVKIDWELNREGGFLELSQSQDPSSTWGVIARGMSADTRSYIWHTPPFELEKVWLRLDVFGGRSKIIGPFAIKGAASVDTKPAKTFSVYPNPASGSISLAIAIKEPVSIDIINAAGEIVSKDARFTGSKIDVSGLPVGCYTLRIVEGSGTESVPIAVVR